MEPRSRLLPSVATVHSISSAPEAIHLHFLLTTSPASAISFFINDITQHHTIMSTNMFRGGLCDCGVSRLMAYLAVSC